MKFDLFKLSSILDNKVKKYNLLKTIILSPIILVLPLILFMFNLDKILILPIILSFIFPLTILNLYSINLKRKISFLFNKDIESGISNYFKDEEFIIFFKNSIYSGDFNKSKNIFYQIKTEINEIENYKELEYTKCILIIEEEYEKFKKTNIYKERINCKEKKSDYGFNKNDFDFLKTSSRKYKEKYR
jgi:hypothetical protein